MSSHSFPKIDQKEYLKKYLSGNKLKKKKKDKKHKKSSVSAKVKIIDDDLNHFNSGPEIDEELLLTGDDAPQVVGECIEEEPSDRKIPKWKSIVIKDESEDEQIASELWGRQSKEVRVKQEFAKDKSRSQRPLDNSPPRRKEQKRISSLSPSTSKRRSSSPQVTSNRHKSPSRYRNNKQSPDRITKIKDEPQSPLYNKRNDSSSLRKNGRSFSPPRRRVSDQSPPRRDKSLSKNTRQHSNDQIPAKRSRSSDQSPPRRGKSPNRKINSPSSPRRNKSPDQSPPRRRKRRDSDQSPTRRHKKYEQPPPSHGRKGDPSPVRKSKNSFEFVRASPGKGKNTPDQSPPRRKRNLDQSPARRNSNYGKQAPDQSPPRRKRDESRRNSKSPLTQIKREKRTPDLASPPRSSRWKREEAEKSRSPPPTHKPKPQKTLDGKKSGLQDAKSLQKETTERRRREDVLFETMSTDISGRNAEVQVRSTGRKGVRARDAAKEDPEERRRRQEHEEKKKNLYDRWGKGLKQIEDHKKRMLEQEYESSKPLARYSNDEDLERHLKEQERAEDPMLEYMRKKRKEKEKESGKPQIPRYEGSFPENRFGIRPGYRWDGVDRSNGYEQKWFAAQNEKKAGREEAYKYSVADM